VVAVFPKLAYQFLFYRVCVFRSTPPANTQQLQHGPRIGHDYQQVSALPSFLSGTLNICVRADRDALSRGQFDRIQCEVRQRSQVSHRRRGGFRHQSRADGQCLSLQDGGVDNTMSSSGVEAFGGWGARVMKHTNSARKESKDTTPFLLVWVGETLRLSKPEPNANPMGLDPWRHEWQYGAFLRRVVARIIATQGIGLVARPA
jgi:hypothetical protein